MNQAIVTMRVVFACVVACQFLGCSKKADTPQAQGSGTAGNVPSQSAAPVAAPSPAIPEKIADTNNMDAILAELTRELHRTMIGRRLSGSFEEFVAVRNLKVPPPPSGKKYAISKQWRVILVDAK